MTLCCLCPLAVTGNSVAVLPALVQIDSYTIIHSDGYDLSFGIPSNTNSIPQDRACDLI